MFKPVSSVARASSAVRFTSHHIPPLRSYATISNASSNITVHKITPPSGSSFDFGAEIRGADLENISQDDFAVIRRALYENQVILFKKQQALSPFAQFKLTQLFDPSAGS